VGGFGFDTALAWAAGKGNFVGTWPVVWHHMMETPGSKTFVAAFTKKYGKPPENQAWGDYNATKIMARAMAETKSTDSTKIVELFEKGAKFDLLKTRPGYFRASDHQIMHEMYAVTAVPAENLTNQWDIFTSSPPVPGPDEDLEVIATTKDEATCAFT
jgi:branched-chain amino acid transport system substrate-binding protein